MWEYTESAIDWHCKHWKHAFVQISLDSKRGCGFAVDKRPPVRYYDPATKKRQRKFLGKGHIPADGVTRSGVWLQTRTKNGCGTGESC